jgi:hypothetical protein
MQAELKVASADVNFWTCILVAVFLLSAVIRLELISRNGNYKNRFVFYSATTWWLSWVSWVFLWLIARMYPEAQLGTLPYLSMLLLSDLNTVFHVLTYIGLTRGREFPPIQYLLVGVLLTLSLGGIDASLLLFPGKDAGAILHQQWSATLSVIAPVLIGWAFRLRYGTHWVLIVGVVYAFLQPPAYAALFGQSFSIESGAAILSILSMMKIIYAFSVIYFLGRVPTSSESLIQLPTAAPDEKAKDSVLNVLAPLLLITGISTVAAVVYYRRLNIAWTVFGLISGHIMLLGGLLAALGAIGKRLELKKETIPESQTTGDTTVT